MDTKISLATRLSCSKLHFVVESTIDYSLKLEPNNSEVLQKLRSNAKMSISALDENSIYIYALQPFIGCASIKLSARELEILEKWPANQIDYYIKCFKSISESFSKLLIDGNSSFVDLNEVISRSDLNGEFFIDSVHVGDRGNLVIAKVISEHAISTLKRKFKINL